MLHNLEAQVPAKTVNNLIVLDNNFSKSSNSNQSLSEGKISSYNTQVDTDIDFLGGVVDLFGNPISCLHGYGCGFEYYPHIYNVDHNGLMAGQIPANVYMQFKEELNRGSVDITVIPMYNDKNEHVYKAILYDNNVDVGHTAMYPNYNSDSQNYQQALISFTNFEYYFQSYWACIVYIHGGVE